MEFSADFSRGGSTFFEIKKNRPYLVGFDRLLRHMVKLKFLAITVVGGFLACTNYNLDERIRAAVNGSSSSAQNTLTFTNVQGGTVVNGIINYTLSNNTKFTATVTSNGSATGISLDTSSLPSYLQGSVTASGTLELSTKSSAASLPTTFTTSQMAPTLRFVFSSGGSTSVQTALSLKRAFATSLTTMGNLTGGTMLIGSCTGSPANKLNCACQNRAIAGNLKNSSKYRAWISETSTHARCNVTSKASLFLTSVGGVLVNNAGSGYNTVPSVTVTGGGCAGVTASAIIANGGVRSVMINSPGSGCSGSPVVSFTPTQGGISAIAILGGCNIAAADGGPWFTTETTPKILAYDMGAENANSGSIFSAGQPLINALNFDEFGAMVGGEVFTGTQATGDPAAATATHFLAWSSTAAGGFKGSTEANGPSWTNAAGSGVSEARGIYCFEAD